MPKPLKLYPNSVIIPIDPQTGECTMTPIERLIYKTQTKRDVEPEEIKAAKAEYEAMRNLYDGCKGFVNDYKSLLEDYGMEREQDGWDAIKPENDDALKTMESLLSILQSTRNQ